MPSEPQPRCGLEVLMLTQVLPYPPDSGGKIKAYHLLRHLAQNHRVTLASLIRSEGDQELGMHLAPYCTRIETILLRRSRLKDGLALARSQLNGVPFVILRDQVVEMTDLVQRLVQETQPDLLHIVQLNMAPYALHVLDIPKVLDQENAVSTIVERMYRTSAPGPKKLLAYLEWRRLAKYEGRVCRQFDHVLTVSEADKTTLGRLAGGAANITAIPIGVDCESVQPIPRREEARGILSVGTMLWPPNADGVLWFAQEVLPLVRHEVPEARFYVVGKDPPGDVRRLQEDHQAITVTGYVNDLTPYFAGSSVFVVPLRIGGGMRVKILDAWARGIPIVSTTIGCEGIEVRDGENILVADEPQAFAQAVVRLMGDRETAGRLVESGRRWVRKKYDWRIVYKQLDAIYEQLGSQDTCFGSTLT